VLPLLARARRLDVLHVPSYRRMLWPRPCALVTTIHDLAPFHVEGKYDAGRMFYGRTVARWLAHRQDRIIAVSHNTGSDIARFFKVSPEKISVIHNGLDHTRFAPDSSEAETRFVLRKYGLRQPFFLYVARLEHPGKNHVRLVEAFDRFKAETRSEWQLVFGGSDWHGAPSIRAAIGHSPFSSDIHCLGFVEHDALAMLYRAASVFVYPSLFEGFGFPPLEAMACGCPVLCSTRGALGEIVGDAAATVDPEDGSALQTQLARLASDPALRAKLHAAGLTHAQRFDWQRTASKTLEVYAAAFQAAPAPGLVTRVREHDARSQARTEPMPGDLVRDLDS
jgi:glycosyltransferase involved in cell wall biosynthesis